MTQIIDNYAQILYELGVSPELAKETKRRFLLTAQLQKALESPVITKEEKHKLIDRIFEEKLHSFLKVLSDNRSMKFLPMILEEYHKVYHREQDILAVSLYYVTKPSSSQQEKIAAYLRRRFGGKTVQITMIKQEELVGGFIIRVGDHEMDWSLRGRFKRLEQRLVKHNI